MSFDNWLKTGTLLPDGETAQTLYVRGNEWQLYTTASGGYALLVTADLYSRWIARDLLEEGLMFEMSAGDKDVFVVTAPAGRMISSVEFGPFPQNTRQVLDFASAVRAAGQRTNVSLADGLYISSFSLVLPTFTDREKTEVNLILGRWICGGMNIYLSDTARIRKYASFLDDEARLSLLSMFGLEEREEGDGSVLSMPRSIDGTWKGADRSSQGASAEESVTGVDRWPRQEGDFCLPGRTDLERFFREEILDVIDREEEYAKFGVGFPGPTLLYGPSGSGKTFAVEKLVDYLGWPIFRITSGTVGSKYIHETSRNISRIFDKAIKEAPSVLIIDELEAFLLSRDQARGNVEAHIEEVGEFLRRIPEAAGHHVLVFGMTNMPDSIDQAILRKGRFDHKINVDMPSQEEVRDVLDHLLEELPTEGNLELSKLSRTLAGRPLSDVAFVVSEAGKISVREKQKAITAQTLQRACGSVAPVKKQRKFGFNQ
ncbi:MAG: ATP-binding protein [Oscillospiraceae bacterium]|nr:ATP-binding protein [Oscillospiraceae bacterium]